MLKFLEDIFRNKNKVTKVMVIIIPVLLVVLVFRKYIFEGLLPIPGDIVPGLYFPWFDYKWGYATPIPVKNSLPSDVVSIMFPWRIMGMEQLRQLQLPLWDPTILLGTPLLANFQSAIMNPLNVLYFIFTNGHAWSIQVMLQPIFMIIAMYVFLKSIKLSTFPSLFGGILYAFSGYAIVWMEYNSINFTLVYFPLILWSVKKIVEEDRFGFLILALLTALQILSGYPLNVIFTLVFAFAYLIFISLYKLNIKDFFGDDKLTKGSKHKYKILFTLLIKRVSGPVTHFIIGILLGFGLSAVQIIPSLELQNISIRNFDTVALSGGVKYLPPEQLITLLIPDYFGNPGTGNYWGSGSYDNFAFSISSIGIYFALLYLFFRKHLSKLYLFYILSALSVFVFVTENPLSIFFGNLFPSSVSNVNTRALFIVGFILSVFAAKGLDLSFKNRITSWKYIIPVIFYIVILAYLAVKLFSGDFPLTIKSIISQFSYVYRREESNYFVAFKNTLLPGIFTVLSFFVLLVTKTKKSIGLILIFLLLIFSVVKSTDKYLSFTRQDLMYPNTPVIEFLQDTSNARFGKERKDLIFPSNTWSLYKLESAAGQNASSTMLTAKYLSVINNSEYRNVSPSRYQEVWNTGSPLYKTLNISHYLVLNWDKENSPSPLGEPNDIYLSDKFEKDIKIGSVSIYKNTDNLGMAWYPESVVCEDGDDKIFEELTGSEYDPAQRIYINCDNDIGKNKNSAKIQIIKSRSNYKIFETDTERESFLVVSSAYYPGWVYYVDGKNRTAVYKANTALTALKVPSGKHTIKLIYDPESFKIGVAASGVTLIIWIFLLKKRILNRK